MNSTKTTRRTTGAAAKKNRKAQPRQPQHTADTTSPAAADAARAEKVIPIQTAAEGYDSSLVDMHMEKLVDEYGKLQKVFIGLIDKYDELVYQLGNDAEASKVKEEVDRRLVLIENEKRRLLSAIVVIANGLKTLVLSA